MRSLKRWLWQISCHVVFWSGAGPFWSWLARKHAPVSWTVLAYHRIGPPVWDGGPDRVSPARFRRHARYVHRRYDVVPVEEALERLASGRCGPKPLLSITFDDGYKDNVTTALPILEAEGCRATLYVTVEAVRDGRPPWTHRLAADLASLARHSGEPAPAGQVSLHPVLVDWLRTESQGPRPLSSHIDRTIDRVKALPEPERARICEEASHLSNGAGKATAEMVRSEDLLRWRRSGMEIGSHTTTHRILSRLTEAERHAELSESKHWLERLLQGPIAGLAYPNGRQNDWDEATVRDTKSSGYHSAVTTIEGINPSGFDRFLIKRINVGNDSIPVFATRVGGVFSRIRARLNAGAAQAADRPARAGSQDVEAVLGQVPERKVSVAFIGGRGVGSAYSGIERYYEEIGSRLAARGHRVLVYCRPDFDPRVKVFRGMEVRRIPTLREKHLETLLHTALATIDVCFRRVDLVQFHALGSSPFSWVPRLTGKKTVVSVRGLDWQRAKWGGVARACLRFCERTSIHCPNATAVVSKTLQRHFFNRFGRKVWYIPNGVTKPDHVPPEEIRRWGLDRRNYLFYAGRLSPEKGLERLIEAHASVASDVYLVIAGGSSYSEKYIERLKARRAPRVVFTGFVTGRMLEELYGNALAFVLPSQMEGLSVALLEAMSHGLPVVASDIPENRELVDECGGFLFRLDDVADLTRVLKHVVADPAAALKVGERSRERVCSRFDWDRIAAETLRFYRDVLDGSTSGNPRAATEAPVA